MSSPRLTAALADCLDQIEAGVPPAAALAACPEDLRADLARLVETTRTLRSLPPRPPRAAFRADLQAELAGLEAAADRRRRAWSGGPFGAPILRRFGRPAGGAAWAARWLAAVGVVVLLLAGTVAVSANSRPGDRLFAVKRLVAWVWPAFGGADGQFDVPSDADASGETSGEINRETGSKPRREPAAGSIAPAPTVIARRGRVDWEDQVSRASSKDALASKGTDAFARSAAAGTGAVATGPRRSNIPAAAPIAAPATADPATILPTAVAPATTPAPESNPPDSGSPRGGPRPGNPPPGGDPQRTSTPAGVPTNPATDPPRATPSPAPGVVTGDFSVSGQVKRLDGSPEGQPLAGAEVQLFRIDGAPDCALGPGAALGRQITAADGGYRFEALSAGTYLVAAARPRAEGDPECLPLRWHVRGGPAVPGLCDALPSAFTLDDATPGRAWTNIHVLYDGDARCGGVE